MVAGGTYAGFLNTADVAIHNMPHSRGSTELGLDYDAVSGDAPDLVMVSITVFGYRHPPTATGRVRR